jgi:UDP-N-acetylmuramoyl-tripeptide--D-alanyl-D-alanine ligase
VLVKSVGRCFKSLEHGFKNRLTKPIKGRATLGLSRCYRTALHCLGETCFIGVTGSCGKTTTTELIAAILAGEGPVQKGSHENTIRHFARTVLAVSPKHRFCVSEISGHARGTIAQATRLLRPHIGVVTHVGQDHYASFRTLEATAAEKGTLVEALPVDGTAVLNADDPHVYAMRTRTRARVITFGLSPGAEVRGENVTSVWPARMSLDVSHAGMCRHVQTQLLGTHWTSTVLASLATALAAGVALERAVEAVEAFAPIPYRMSPHETPGGITFISDTWKAPLWAIPAALDFLRAARAERKVVVIGSVSDTPKGFYHRYKAVAEQALDMAAKVLFVGDHARAALRARRYPDDDRIMAFDTLYRLDAYLRTYLQAGDLVLLKGVTKNDHLHRLVLSRTGEMVCWRENCGRRRFCEDCRLLYEPFTPAENTAGPAAGDDRKE